MKNRLLAMCIGLLAVACSTEDDGNDNLANGDETLPTTSALSPIGQEVWDSSAEYASSWERVSNTALESAHGGMWVHTYFNQSAANAMADQTDSNDLSIPFPDGTVFIKDMSETADGPVVATTIMSKRDGQWYWIKATTDGSVMHNDKGTPIEGFGDSGQVNGCIGCHSPISETKDWVFQRLL